MEATTALVLLSLITTAPPSSDNVTEAGNNVSTSPGKSPPKFYASFYISPTLSKVVSIATITVAVVGFLANAYVLLALLLSKNSRKSNINVFIAHQIILDLTACIFLFIGLVITPTDITYSLTVFVCMVFKNFAIAGTAGNASTCGLMIITIERYVKIVHPVAYRNHYQSWMTRAGIIIPWIFGIFVNLIPTLASTTIVRGRCVKNRIGLNRAQEIVWSVVRFLLLYLGPLVVFVFGYLKILAVIRRQRKQVGQSQAHGTSSATTTATEKGNRRTEMNIIRTMVLVSISYALCFGCMRTYSILTSLNVVPAVGMFYVLFSFFSYANAVFNPFIYATQYEVVRKWWRNIVCRVVRGQNWQEASVTPTDAAQKQPTSKVVVALKQQ